MVKHPAGNVCGLTHIDFIALPARARIALVYAGDAFGEGFICLRKLWQISSNFKVNKFIHL